MPLTDYRDDNVERTSDNADTNANTRDNNNEMQRDESPEDDELIDSH